MPAGRKRQAAQLPLTAPKKARTTNSKKAKDDGVAATSSPARDSSRSNGDGNKSGNNEEPLIPKGVKWEKWVDSFRKIVDQKEQDILRQVAERKTAMCIHISTFSSFQVALVADHRTFHSDADSKELRAHELNTDPDPITENEQTKKPPGVPLLNFPITSTDNQQYCINIRSLIDSSYDLIFLYNDLIPPYGSETSSSPVKSKSPSKPLQERLKIFGEDIAKDKAAVLAQLAAGKKVVVSDVQGMLADRMHEVRGRGRMGRDEEQMGRVLLEKAKKYNKGHEKAIDAEEEDEAGEEEDEEGDDAPLLGWGNMAFDMQRAVKGLGKIGG